MSQAKEGSEPKEPKSEVQVESKKEPSRIESKIVKIVLPPSSSPSPNATAPHPEKSTGYSTWGGIGGSLTSLEARSMPVHKSVILGKVDGKATGKAASHKGPIVEELLDELYQRQYRHGLSDSCSSASSYTGGDSTGGRQRQQLRQQKQFGPYATKESIKRSGFYGACCSAVFLLTLLIVGLAVGLPLVLIKLKDLEKRLEEIPSAKP